MFRKILIANRGEIAARIERTCRRLGIDTVLATPPFLDIPHLIHQAQATGAGAVHPGYGFLAENAAFARACAAANLVFVGPPANVIEALATKERGRAIAESAGVPVVPATGFPLLIKASAGGGGRGMRIVEREADLQEAIESARSEAERAFGDGSLVFERWIPDARHVEIQILGDQHGNLVHIFERECSIQRRHQKLIEESPSPFLDAGLRDQLCDAALQLARAVRYENAGTVEFLVAPDRMLYFIEVNTRIQVEHPVTEERTGLDLIELQLRIAAGQSIAGLAPVAGGHAIEVRVCAEDPHNGFLPSTGHLRVFRWPSNEIRIETGLGPEGGDISADFDSLIAKFIAHADSRGEAIRLLVNALHEFQYAGITTNRNYLLQILESPDFTQGAATTTFQPAPATPPGLEQAARAVAEHIAATVFPAHGLAGYRNNPFRTPAVHLTCLSSGTPTNIVIPLPGATHVTGPIFQHGSHFLAGLHVFERTNRHPKPSAADHSQSANSPMPGKVLRILVEPGQAVQPGQPLLVVEAMKMEQTVRSQAEGHVKSILVKPGDVVAPGQTLVQISGDA